MRIAFVADTLQGWIGGGIVAGRHLVERLRRDHEVVVLGADVEGPGVVKLPGFRVPLRAMEAMAFTMAWPDRARIRAAVARADVVHLHFPFWVSFVALAEARAAGVPAVAAFHVQPENMLYNIGVRSPALSRAGYRLWVRHFYNLADAVLCPSPFAEDRLRQYGLTAPAHVVSNGASPDLRKRSLRSVARGPKKTILAVGRLAPEKRVDLIIDAVARSRYRDRIELVIAGAGPLEAKVRAWAAKLPHVEVGFLERERLEELFNTADLFVHASEVELEGIAVLEAMSLGLPALVADSADSAAAGFALDDRFLFRSGDAASLAAKIDALFDDPRVLDEAQARSIRAAERYDFGRGVDQVVEVYRSLAREGAAASSVAARASASWISW
ncbi:MAG TPA: glycosyltransferase [Polyangiaceae bacterium]|nr:glycosyltransferase [Polyangiaceae bacterium]